ncbi:hypothetical protein [Cetobacterium somerae]
MDKELNFKLFLILNPNKFKNLIRFNGIGQDYYFNIGLLKIAILKIYAPNKEVKNIRLPISFQSSETYAILVEPNKNFNQIYNTEYGIQTTRISQNEIQIVSNYPTNYGCRLICIGI